MDITFNTGRPYTKDGQIIRAVWDKGAGKIHFYDQSRMITGTVMALGWDASRVTAYEIARHLMSEYDRLDYRWSSDSAQLRRDPDAEVHAFRL